MEILMHRVEIRLTNEGNEPVADFEVYYETLKDGNYVEMAPMRKIASGGAPVVLFLEADERVVVVAKGNVGHLVFDKDQNANVRVETEAEREARKQREATVAKSQADQAVRAAHAEAESVKTAGVQAQASADANVKKAEANAAKVQAVHTPTASRPVPQPPRAGAPVSTHTGPIDSKQVKKDA